MQPDRSPALSFFAVAVVLGSLVIVGCDGQVLRCADGSCESEPASASVLETGTDGGVPIGRVPSPVPAEPVPPTPPATPIPTPPAAEEPDPPTVYGCPVFPSDNDWNRDISHDPVDGYSAQHLTLMNAATGFLHPYFGSDTRYGIPVVAVTGDQAKVPMAFAYWTQSDPGPYPVPLTAPVEGGPSGSGDRHIVVIETWTCQLYEVFDAWRSGSGYSAGSGAKFDLWTNDRRPVGWTSADAAGLPILPGLVRYDEVQAGEIRHALRFTVEQTQRGYVSPASHFASELTDPLLPPMGLRVRLKANYDLSRFHGAPLVILKALKKYGMIVADNGRDWSITGESNARWNDAELRPLNTVPGSAFEVVQHEAVRQ